MNDATPDPGRPRRTFLEPPPKAPFLKTREGRLIAALGVLCLVASGVLVLQYQKTAAALERAAAERALAEQRAAAEPPLAERLAAKRAQLGTVWEGALADSANGDDFLESGGYSKLVEQLALLAPEEVAKRSERYLEHKAALAEPDLLRGEFVRVRGVLGGLFAVKLERAVHDVTDVWRGTVSQPNAEETVVFDYVGERPKVELRRDVVEVDGIFYRTVRYESKDHQWQTSPYLLARGIRVLDVESASGATNRMWAILLGIAAIVGYLTLRSALRKGPGSGKPTPRLRMMLEERMRARRGEQS